MCAFLIIAFQLLWISLFFSLESISMGADIPHIQVHGHRGTRGLFPENTIPAFESALNSETDILEMDLAVTKNGILVVSHDPHINAEICLDPNGEKIISPPLIHSLTLTEVKQFDCGKLKNLYFEKQTPVPGTRIPTLEEVFDWVHQSSHPHAKLIGFNIETKSFPDHPEYTVSPREFAQKVVASFRKSGFWDRITLQSFDPRTLIEAKKIDSRINVVLLVEDSKINMINLGKKVQASTISPDFKLLSKRKVFKIHQAGFRVIPWVANEVKDWKSLIEMRVDGIITDYPAALKGYLKSKGIR